MLALVEGHFGGPAENSSPRSNGPRSERGSNTADVLGDLPHRILLVDDDDDIRETMKDFLEDNGYEVDAVENGRDALSVLRGGGPPHCLVLLDLMMPVMDGWAFRKEQANDPELCAIPVVVVSAVRDSTSMAELGAVECLAKPVRLDKLLEVIRRNCPPPGGQGQGPG